MKKRISLLIAIVLLFVAIQSQFALAAEKINPARISDFNVFFKHLKKAVKSRDKVTLKKMMGKMVSYSFGPGEKTPGAAIKHIEKYKLWDKFDQILNKGFAYSKDLKGYVSPPEYATGENYMAYRAGFVKENGFWKLIFFVSGD